MGAVGNLLDRAGLGPAALVVEGEAGIGKTTTLLEAIDRARDQGFTVLSAHGAAPEVSLAFAALTDLLAGVDEAVFQTLPAPQRLALERARAGVAEGPPTAERVSAAGVLTVLETLSKSAPVLMAVDDAQWLDHASRAVLAYTARRLQGRVGILMTLRTGEPDSGTSDWLQLRHPDMLMRVTLPPKSLGALHAIVSSRLGRGLPRPEITRIHSISGGNPFYALELARVVGTRTGGAGDLPDLPDSLLALVSRRLGVLDPDVLAMLRVAALAADPTTELLAAATGEPMLRVAELLEPAEQIGIVVIEGHHIRFSHPLLAAGVAASAAPADRRRTHRLLAAAVGQPELKARHLALGSVSADADTLAALDAAAEATRQQGAPATAAELVELAIRLDGDTPERRLLAANHHFAAGDFEGGRAVLAPALATMPPGLMRSLALALLAGIYAYTQGYAEAERYVREALPGAQGHPAVVVPLYLMLVLVQFNDGRVDEVRASLAAAWENAEQLADDSITSQVLSMSTVIGFLSGEGVGESRARALELEVHSPDVPVAFRASVNEAQLRAWEGDLDGAAALIEQERRSSAAWGAETELLYHTSHRMLIAIWRGDLAEAANVADEALEHAQQLGGENALSIAMTQQTMVAVFTGRVDDARTFGGIALDTAQRSGLWRAGKWPRHLIGFLEVSLGRYPEALQHLDPLIQAFPDDSCTEIIRAWFVPDAVEALIGVGRLEEAERLIVAMETSGARVDRPWIRCVGARGRAMLLAAQGDLTGAEDVVSKAISLHQRMSMPFEQARTLLLLGQIRRRRRHRGAATATLTQARTLFEKVGAQLWVQRVDDELGRLTKQSANRSLGLTDAENRVAQCAAAGLSNKQIAAEMYISPKTVEANLSSVYRKLGIRSRSQLAQHLPTLTPE